MILDSGEDACILFKVRRLGRTSSHASSSREAFVWQMVFLTLPANDCTVAACKLLHFTVFNVLSGGDQPRPDDPHPFFAWGTSGASRRWSQLRLFQRGSGCWASRDSLGSVKRGAVQTNQVPFNWSFSLAYVYVIHPMFFFAQGSLDKREIGAVRMSMRSYSFALSCLILLVSCCQIL